MMYDLIVIGGGPAGCSAAIGAARESARVLLLERGQFPRHKVCGEFVSAESLELLEELLAPEHRQLVSRAPRIAQARIFSDGAEIPAEIKPAAASIARHDLDFALWQSARACGVEARENCGISSVERIEQIGTRPSFFRVRSSAASFESKALINAAGRWSLFSSVKVRNRAGIQRWVGIKAHFHEYAPPESVDLYFFPGGYCGVQPVQMGATGATSGVNACAMVRAEVATSLDQVFAAHPVLRERSEKWEPATKPVTTSPLIFHAPEPVRNEIIQVGDAATFVDPFIGDGISLALRSGDLAARSLQPFFRSECSWSQCCAEYERQYRQQLAPVFRASSQLRTFLKLPAFIRRPVMSLLERTPSITRGLVRMTR